MIRIKYIFISSRSRIFSSSCFRICIRILKKSILSFSINSFISLFCTTHHKHSISKYHILFYHALIAGNRIVVNNLIVSCIRISYSIELTSKNSAACNIPHWRQYSYSCTSCFVSIRYLNNQKFG